MNTPKHSRKIFDPLTGKAEIITFNAWLGSGKKDKNGKEIFEGDIVDLATGFVDEHIRTIAIFRGCGFDLIREEDWNEREHCGAYILGHQPSSCIEVVGHIAQD